MQQELSDISSTDDIKILVDHFYSKALKDNKIGFFFTEVIQLEFEKHMPTMVLFWDSILFGTASYKGNPMLKHLALNQKSKLNKDHFERWLFLWKKSIDELFVGETAKAAVQKAISIADLMQYKISQESE